MGERVSTGGSGGRNKEIQEMIRYHGLPITPVPTSLHVLQGRHALVSFFSDSQISRIADVVASFIIDNGAYSIWRSGKGSIDIRKYAEFVNKWRCHPAFDWCLIPDSITGDVSENKRMLREFMRYGFSLSMCVPVFHLHEPLSYLAELIEMFPRVALGSSGEYARPKTTIWWKRMEEISNFLCRDSNTPNSKIHALRMMDPEIFSVFPFSSVDSCHIAMNVNLDVKWSKGYLRHLSKEARAVNIATYCEHAPVARIWNGRNI